MRKTGIKELKNRLSYYLASVKAGEDIIVTDRGRPIARIIPETPQNSSWKQAIQPLVAKGVVRLPTQQIDKDIPNPIEIPGRPISEIAIEDRR